MNNMASVRQAVSVNITPTGTTQSANRESAAPLPMRMSVNKVNFFYGAKQTLFDINLGIAANKVTALIGPSGCGKSTLLRTFNRMHETVRHARLEGEILLDGTNILSQDVTQLRRKVGMVFQRPNPFPKSIFDNVAYGLKINGSKLPIADAVEKSLRHAALWDEVKDHLHKTPMNFPAASSSASALRAASPSNLKSSSSTSPAPRSIPSAPQKSKSSSSRSKISAPSPSSPTTCSKPPASAISPPSS